MSAYDKCLACGQAFQARNTGALGCFGHPGEMDLDTQHYTCCGLTDVDSACRGHAQSSHAIPMGCHRMDHFATLAERTRVLRERPYIVAPLDQVIESMPRATKANGRTIFHIENEKDLDNTDFSIPLALGWDGTRRELFVSLRDEHDTLRQAIADRDRAVDALSTDPYAEVWNRHVLGVEEVVIPPFVPFAIILRISPDADEERTTKSSSRCRY